MERLVVDCSKPQDHKRRERVVAYRKDELLALQKQSAEVEVAVRKKQLDEARLEALAKVWPDPFALLDDMLIRGVEAVLKDRKKIKAKHPKG